MRCSPRMTRKQQNRSKHRPCKCTVCQIFFGWEVKLYDNIILWCVQVVFCSTYASPQRFLLWPRPHPSNHTCLDPACHTKLNPLLDRRVTATHNYMYYINLHYTKQVAAASKEDPIVGHKWVIYIYMIIQTKSWALTLKDLRRKDLCLWHS